MYYYFERVYVQNLSSLIMKPIEPCPKYNNIMIGSSACCYCKYNEENTDEYIVCSVLDNETLNE